MSQMIIYSTGLPSSVIPPPTPVSGIDVFIGNTVSNCEFTLSYNDGVSPQTDTLDETNTNSNPVNITISGNLTITTVSLPPNGTMGGNTTTYPCSITTCCPIEVIGSGTITCTDDEFDVVYTGITIQERDNSYNVINTFTYTVPFTPNVSTKFIEIIVNATYTLITPAGCTDCE